MHAESKSSLYFSYLCLMRFGSFFVETYEGFGRFLQHVKFQVDTTQSDFPEVRPCRKQ